MFIGRKQELVQLNQMYESENFEFAIIYGRRRVGKSTLINEFSKNKNSIYYMAIEASLESNLKSLSKMITDHLMPGVPFPPFSDVEALLTFIDTYSKERLILTIDEYPYLAEAYPPLSSLIQRHIDETWKHGKLLLILCGSSMSFMEQQVLGYKSPLYGRRTAQFKIMPFRYTELKQFQWNYTNEELAQIYGITSGIGEYLHAIDPSKSVDENIIALYMNPNGRMFEEPTNLLKQELRDPKMYHSILEAIAGGASTLNEIASKAKENSAACAYHLKSLISLGIIKKETPIGLKEQTRKTIYSILDSSFLFWFRFVSPSVSMIMQNNGDIIYDCFVKPNLNEFMGTVFERMSLEYMEDRRTLETAPFIYQNIGRWWGSNPVKKREEEIDICAMNKNQLLIGECKWTTKPVDMRVVRNLIEQSGLFKQESKYYYLFSKNGFQEDVLQFQRDHANVFLICLNDFY